jgi:hypothetical protein
MLAFLSNQTTSRHKHTSESTVIDSAYNNYTITNQEDIRKKISYLFSKNVLFSIKVPGKFAASTLLTTITCIRDGYIFLDGFQDERFNKDLLLQSTLVASADFEGIAVNFILSDIIGMDIDTVFSLKAPFPQSIEWVQRRNARRVKVPINIPVKVQYKNQAECFDVADISVSGLSYINQTEDRYIAAIGGRHTDCNIILPDKSVFLACFEIVNNITVPCQHARQITRIGCEIKRVSYRLDTALQHLINQIDFYYQ